MKVTTSHEETRQYYPFYLILISIMASTKFIQMFITPLPKEYPLHYRIRMIRGENLEMPDDFDNELCKWGFECKYP
jgi:hypothetical protein